MKCTFFQWLFRRCFLPLLSSSFFVCAATVAADLPAEKSIKPSATAAPLQTADKVKIVPQIDPNAMALLEKVQATMIALESYRAEARTTNTFA